MNKTEIFGNAQWLTGANDQDAFFILRARFTVNKARKAVLRAIGLGFFHAYINGKRVGEDLFLPLNSEYEPREQYPKNEQLSGFHTYVPEYDVTDMLQEGENVLALHFGGGWYTFKKGSENSDFGCAKAIWRLFGEQEGGSFDFVSSEQDKISASYISGYCLTIAENHDYTKLTGDVLSLYFDDSQWKNACLAKPVDTQYEYCDCPFDRVQECINPRVIKQTEKCTVYDCGKNISGYPVITINAKRGGQVCVQYSEDITLDGDLDEKYRHLQRTNYISDGIKRTVWPLFTWFGFRYFAVYGEAKVERVEVVYTNVKRISGFVSDNEDLNWLHDAYVQTQLTNLHAGIPSDCPHIERRGYTGDGQLTCKAAMQIFDGKAFYKKWIRDIADGQDRKTGHVQYTAPYIRSGGGPGGWGSAMVEIPYRYYLEYGDKALLREYYPHMRKYLDFLEAHSSNDFVVSDVEGVWCLGEWCTVEETRIPEPFVNTYFYVKALQKTLEIAKMLTHTADIAEMQDKIQQKKKALLSFMDENGNFAGGEQGANLFALDLGLGNEKTCQNVLAHYRKLGEFDTGMFGTYLLLEWLFKRGEGELASKLLTSKGVHSFTEMKRRGATTIWEYWPESFKPVRSKNHPMFGACVALFYDYYLGIQAKDDAIAYEEITIQPVIVNEIRALSGWRILPSGKVLVAYQKKKGGIEFTIEIPQKQRADFIWKGKVYPLQAGENKFLLE